MARRETDVCDNFFDSAWYFFRYPSAKDETRAFDPERTRRWLPVDMYIGGNEHAVLHLMYTRFMTMAFCNMGLIDFEEPFKRFRANGILDRAYCSRLLAYLSIITLYLVAAIRSSFCLTTLPSFR